MIIYKTYDPDKKEQKVWYESSMILYSKMVEDPNENKGDLYVVFKNGSQYVYKDVRFEDYVVFVAGGTDNSNGTALNKLIKPKYEFEKLEPMNVSLLMEELTKFQTQEKEKQHKKQHTIFLSGDEDITEEEFIIVYEKEIEDATLENNEEYLFVIGDNDGFDIIAQNFLFDDLKIEPNRVTIYHTGNTPKNANSLVINKIGGFATDEECDEAMTKASFKDIAHVQGCDTLTSTAKNILRRHSYIVN